MPLSISTIKVLLLPIPPSVNALYLNRKGGRGRGRIKTPAYRLWLAEADRWFLVQKRGLRPKTTGQLTILIELPASIRGDVSNRIKAAEDYLVSREITGDDKNNWEVTVRKDKLVDCCKITISPSSGS
jgi:Holliday junction resolvase RusA-like endonuclease